MAAVILILCVIVLSTWLLFRVTARRPVGYPPGPIAFPLVGNLIGLRPSPAEAAVRWGKQCASPIISIFYGTKPQVIVNSYELAKSVFSEENASGRDQNFLITRFLRGKGFLGSEHELWRQNRRLVLSILHDLGMGSSWMEEVISGEIRHFLSRIRQTVSIPLDPIDEIKLSVSNIICALIFGGAFDHSDPDFVRLLQLLNSTGQYIKKVMPIEILPILRYLPLKSAKAYKDLESHIREMEELIKEMVAKHRSRKDGMEKSMCFIDLYEEEMKTNKRPEFNEQELTACALGLLAAGIDATSVTLQWGLLYLLENPEIVERARREIDRQIPTDRIVQLSDKDQLAFTEAVSLEIQRMASVAPLGLPHTNFEEMRIESYSIPPRTVLSPNLFAMHREESVWNNPHDFDPENFLTSAGGVIVPKQFVPFGVGKRMCLGASLAKATIFLFLANILKSFTFDVAEGYTITSKKQLTTFARKPVPFKIVFELRKAS